jgi:hypothetical protein
VALFEVSLVIGKRDRDGGNRQPGVSRTPADAFDSPAA